MIDDRAASSHPTDRFNAACPTWSGAAFREPGATSLTRVVHENRCAGPQHAGALRISANDYVIEIQRVRLADGSPISLELAQFPADAFPGLLERQLGGSIYEILETHYGLVTARAEERIEAVNATTDEASLLGIKPKSALLLITRIAYDQHGTPCEFSRDLFRGDRTRLAVTVQGRGVGTQSPVDTASVALQRQEVQTKAS